MTEQRTHYTLPLTEAALRIANRIKARDSYVITLPPHAFAAATQRIAMLPGAVVYADNSSDIAAVATTYGGITSLAVVADAIGTFLTGVATVPKTVRSKTFYRALGVPVPDSDEQDIVQIEGDTKGHRYLWPTLFVMALDEVDPEAAKAIREAAVEYSPMVRGSEQAREAMLAGVRHLASELATHHRDHPTHAEAAQPAKTTQETT